MYERHWQLATAPFRHGSGPKFFHRTASHHAALLKLRFVLEQRQASAALIGPSGSGKSFLIRVLQGELPAHIGPMILLRYPELSPLELVRYLCAELSEQIDEPLAAATGMDEWLHIWEKLLRTYRVQGRLPVFIVDDAQWIENRATWQTWQLLLTYREREDVDFCLLLVGQPELVGRLQRIPQLEERLALVCTLPPLTELETAEYVRHRLCIAGRDEAIFDDEALRRIWESSGGIPRRIDKLCDFALLVGFADGATRITPDQIEGVSQELRGRAA